MKKNKLKLVVFALLVFGLSNLQAQETITTSGGEASGSGGTVSYTIGQVFYTTQTGTNGNAVAQGVQQPYEISVVIGIPEAKGINLEVSAYPNPTTNYLQLKVNSEKLESLTYQLYDMQGKLLQNKKLTAKQTQIDMSTYVTSTYFVKVLDNNKEIKVFKIIKTK